MNDDSSRKDIRRLLKTFGIKADEAMVAHLARIPDIESIKVKLTLEDVTAYDVPPAEQLFLTVEDEIKR